VYAPHSSVFACFLRYVGWIIFVYLFFKSIIGFVGHTCGSYKLNG
jgi:hypothetical protein